MIGFNASGESSSESSGTVNLNAMWACSVELESGTRFSLSNMIFKTASTYISTSS